MASISDNLEPQNVFRYFEEISRIPRGSQNVRAISDYCVQFAGKHGLKVYQDEACNVIIKKPASAGRENAPTVIIQGHLDMVCEKETDVSFDFMHDALRLCVDGDFIHASGTTLGGDDGIAVAMALAILADEDAVHPPLEVLLTADEETGMDGARALDPGRLTGRFLINIDSEEEGVITVGCAGGLTGCAVIPADYMDMSGISCSLFVSGLTGGHSGTQIHLGHANANKLMGRLLFELRKELVFGICSVNGGTKDNAIARDCRAELVFAQEDLAAAGGIIDRCAKILRQEYAAVDPNLCVGWQTAAPYHGRVLSLTAAEKVIYLLFTTPYGVCSMTAQLPDLVESSLNLGIVRTQADEITLSWSVRSSVPSKKEMISDQLMYMTELLGGDYTISGNYPAWPLKADSILREKAVAVYEQMFGRPPVVNTIHAGLECGILSEKLPDTEMISIGPDILDIHTPKERLCISSTQRTYQYILALLRSL